MLTPGTSGTFDMASSISDMMFLLDSFYRAFISNIFCTGFYQYSVLVIQFSLTSQNSIRLSQIQFLSQFQKYKACSTLSNCPLCCYNPPSPHLMYLSVPLKKCTIKLILSNNSNISHKIYDLDFCYDFLVQRLPETPSD